jgi:hypothetical protein
MGAAKASRRATKPASQLDAGGDLWFPTLAPEKKAQEWGTERNAWLSNKDLRSHEVPY